MAKINVLDNETINKIAAGEVVERPVSVIKELVENSIDAHAFAITIEIEDGGLSLIRITDNGAGIEKEDVRTAFLRHATSKITSVSELSTIQSLGFRGEALASISAIAMMECITKTKEAMTGVRYKVEGGMEKGFDEIGCPNGTTFVIRQFFYNVPARKKFLKASKTEASYITDVVNRLALSHPGISFKYIVNGKIKLHTSGNFELKDSIYHVFGKKVAQNIVEVAYEKESIKVSGFVGKPEIARGNRQYEIYFVNGRYIKNKWIERGIEDGIKNAMMLHQYPFAVLFVDIEPNEVDVNVHPNKMEVRFDNEEHIYEIVKAAIDKALQQEEPVVLSRFEEKKEEKIVIKEAPEPFEAKRREEENKTKKMPPSFEAPKKVVQEELGFDCRKENTIEQIDTSESKQQTSQQMLEPTYQKTQAQKEIQVQKQKIVEDSSLQHKFLDKKRLPEHKIIGQLFATYWVVEYHKEFFIIDQHAAHEKVLYEKWMNNLREMNIASQGLLEPNVYEVNDQEMENFHKAKEAFHKLGFDAQEFGENTIIVKSVPYLLNKPMQNIDFITLLDGINEHKAVSEEVFTENMASTACKAAIKGNDKLSEAEYEALIDDLLYLDDPYHCPHGRPTMIKMSQYELEKRFKRIV